MLWTVRNDAADLAALTALAPDGVVVSPGPCTPNEAGVSLEAVHHFGGKVPVLGVCLGHQAIGMAFGAKLGAARQVMHGKTDCIRHHGQGVFCRSARSADGCALSLTGTERSSRRAGLDRPK